MDSLESSVLMLYSRLLQATQKNKDSVQTEIQARHSFMKEISDAKCSFEQIATSFQNLAPEDYPERAEELEVSKERISGSGWDWSTVFCSSPGAEL